MCGICGKLNFDASDAVSPAVIHRMAAAMVHRGPDDDGIYVNGPVGLGFRRLSIIDLSTGHQPVGNEDNTIQVVFNGEIYNYKTLRDELLARGHIFRTRTDTEVLVHLYEEHGPALVEKLQGMFAFAIWDNRRQTLLLARDRLGIKPLYYSLTERSLSFGSEVKAILADPAFTCELDPSMIDRFLSFYYMPGTDTLFKDVLKLAPGCYLTAQDGHITVRQYWDLDFSPGEEFEEKEAERQLLAILAETTGSHMMGDVPIGFLLSGGVDSTSLLSFAREHTSDKIRSYTVGFAAPNVVDERPYARVAAERFGTEHHETAISPEQFANFLPKYVWHMEEPVCEPPAIALYYVSRLARESVKVLISGEGGDEVLAGYSNYRNLLWLERMKGVFGFSLGPAGSGFRWLGKTVGSRRLQMAGDRMDMPMREYYLSRSSSPFHFANKRASELYSDGLLGCTNKSESLASVAKYFDRGVSGTLHTMLYVDSKTWLPDDLLIKADKMTMANSIELRVPFLDHKLVEFAARLPANLKVRGNTTKYLAKKALAGRVPPEILARRKAGFPVPYESWLRKDLKGWLHDLLLDKKTMERGYFQRSGIEYLLRENGRAGLYAKELFSLAVLEWWHRVFLEGARANTEKRSNVGPSFVATAEGPVVGRNQVGGPVA